MRWYIINHHCWSLILNRVGHFPTAFPALIAPRLLVLWQKWLGWDYDYWSYFILAFVSVDALFPIIAIACFGGSFHRQSYLSLPVKSRIFCVSLVRYRSHQVSFILCAAVLALFSVYGGFVASQVWVQF